KGFRPSALPIFLEGPVREMKIAEARGARELAQAVRESALFDQKLGMYKINVSLEDQPYEIGRLRAFTPGWLENESIWMHMSYKYLLALINAGLYEEFFTALKTHLPAFMDPQVYGRSPLESCSFIVSSAHPDASLHGAGFVARMSGLTAEFISMWRLMTMGKQPFQLIEGELALTFAPVLPGWLFTVDGIFRFRCLGTCTVTVHNPDRKDTWDEGLKIKRVELHSGDETIRIDGGVIQTPYAEGVRQGEFDAIDLFF
ncbi:MAG: cellobiose phosphorylase, partial [Brevefilum sp.]